MVFSTDALSYTEMKAMDIEEYTELEEAFRLWMEEWKPKPPPPIVCPLLKPRG